jgi:hypothetical protein
MTPVTGQTLRSGIWLAVLLGLGGPVSSAQRGGRGAGAEFAGPPQGTNAVPIVETIGCLADGPGHLWTLSNATEPVRATPGFSKADDVRAADAKPLGTQQIRLIGVVEMHPEQHKGHKVLVKGLLIQDGSGQRLNLTSLATVNQTCGS